MEKTINFESLKFELFDPMKDKEDKIPDKSGNYIVVLREKVELPVIDITPIYNMYKGYRVIYTGISSKNLRKRDYSQHFTGNNAGRSTLRKSLGSLMGLEKIPRDAKKPENGKTKFTDADEEKLSAWMKENLLLFFLCENEFATLEEFLINELNPPLNIQGNKNEVNQDYRDKLRKLRK